MNCGIKTHDDDCLCDVVVHATTPIAIGDGVHGMWMGQQLCDTRGYDNPWTNNKILDYFTDLCTFYDRWSALQTQPTAHKLNTPHQRMVELLKEGYDNRDIRRIIRKEYGVEYSRSAVSHTKRRIGLSTSAKMETEIGGLI